MATKKVDFAEELRVFRAKKRLSQQDVADKIGCSAAYVSQIERGLEPSDELKEKLEAMLNG